MDDDSYLAAIRAAPDDDAVRLVYADVLQARGDPRGELIALQVGQARATGDEAEALGEAAADLLAEHQEAWIPPSLRTLPRHAVSFRRGFLARVALTAAQFEACADELVAAAPGFELVLDLRDVAGATRLASMPHLARVDALTAGAAPDPVCAALLASPHLAGLRSLGGVNVGPEAEAQLARPDGFPALEALHGVFQPASRQRLLASTALPALTRLMSALTVEDVASLGAPHRRARWTELALVAPRIGGDALADLVAPGFPALRELRVPGHIGVAGACAIAGAELPALRRLGLSQAGLGVDGLAALLASPAAARLEVLDLRQCDIPRDADPRFAGVALPALRVLDLASNDVGDGAVRGLAAGDLPALEVLALRGTAVGDDGIAALAGATGFGRLRHLELGHRLSPDGVRGLAEASGLAGLRVLKLPGVPLDDRAVAALGAAAGLPALRSLHVGSYPFESRWFEALVRGPVLAGLVTLACTDATLEDRALIALAGTPAAAGLRHLNLRGSRGHTTASLLVIASSPYLTRLRELEHRWWPLEGHEAKALLAAPGLGRVAALQLAVPRWARSALVARFGARVELMHLSSFQKRPPC